MSQFFTDSIFWVEIEKVHPNPFQPRKEFDEFKLKDLADSIRQYGILQPMVVTRKEVVKEDGGLTTEYELISGERRLRASKIAGLSQVPVLIRDQEESDQLKLELAIIENLQREDLNPVDRAKAFQQLVEQFNFKHVDVARRVGKSREYVSNSLRILMLPENMLTALSEGKISEGHTRPLLMLIDRKEEQAVLFKEMLYRKMSVREAELTARKIAVERVRKIERMPDPELTELEEKLANTFGARVHIERSNTGGKIMIDFFSKDDLRAILDVVNNKQELGTNTLLNRHIAKDDAKKETLTGDIPEAEKKEEVNLLDDRSSEEKEENEQDLYSVNNFTV
jgi:ParB family transcriptional regulator, chromosome partitioning protein